MIKKDAGINLLKRNFSRVETAFSNFFEKGEPRWPSEKHDYLRNHHQSLDQLSSTTLSLEKLKLTGLPQDILHAVHAAFEAFQRGEEYN